MKIRGTAQQVYEKYLSLARDAVSAGDRIAAEGYFQFADHYYRLVNAANGNGQSRGDQGNRIPPPPESAAGQFGGDDGGAAGAGAPTDVAGDDGDDEDEASSRQRDDHQGEPYRRQPQRPADEFRPMRPADPVQRPRFAEEVEDAAPASQAAELAEALARADAEEPADPAPQGEAAAENGTGTGHRRGERTLGLGGRRTLNRRSQAAAAEAPAESSGSTEPETPAAPDVPSAESREGGLFGPKPIRRRVRRVAPRKEPAGAN